MEKEFPKNPPTSLVGAPERPTPPQVPGAAGSLPISARRRLSLTVTQQPRLRGARRVGMAIFIGRGRSVGMGSKCFLEASSVEPGSQKRP